MYELREGMPFGWQVRDLILIQVQVGEMDARPKLRRDTREAILTQVEVLELDQCSDGRWCRLEVVVTQVKVCQVLAFIQSRGKLGERVALEGAFLEPSEQADVDHPFRRFAQQVQVALSFGKLSKEIVAQVEAPEGLEFPNFGTKARDGIPTEEQVLELAEILNKSREFRDFVFT